MKYPRASSICTLVLGSLAIAPPALADSCENELTLPAPGSPDDFGHGVAISGDTVVVGSPKSDDLGMDAGAAFVYVRDGAGWSLQQQLLPSDGVTGSIFGWAVDIEGDTAVVGATEAGFFGIGAAYVFERTGTTWTEVGKLVPSVPSALSQFASTVSISGDTIAVGAPHPQGIVPVEGEAFVYVRNGAIWEHQQRIQADDGAPEEWFGTSVSVSGDRLLVGASKDDPKGPDSGSAYVFLRAGTTWTQEAKLFPANGAPLDRAGAGVAIDGDAVVIGGWGADPHGASGAGSAWAFRRTAGVWSEEGPLTASNGAAGDWFGGALSLSGSTLVAGANGKGSAYVFEHTGGAWTEAEELDSAGGVAGDSFGYSVGASTTAAVCGAHLFPGAGAAYVFELSAGAEFFACPRQLSVSAGGTTTFTLSADSAFAGEFYWVAGSATGTSPGIPFAAGLLPLNFDGYFLHTLLNANAPPLANTFGTLGPLGAASGSLTLSAASNPAWAGLHLNHAYLVLSSTSAVLHTSNAQPLDLVP